MIDQELQKLWRQQLGILVESPVVVARRLMLFSQPFWSLETAQEYQRMYWEKYLAAQQLTMSWASFCMHAGQSLLLAPEMPTPHAYYRWAGKTAQAANRALSPVSRRVHNNRIRLSKRR